MRKGFTLSEVLITLGIIGVLAAVTLPTLVQNHKKKEVATKLKKIYSVMNQAINLSVAEHGDVTTWAKDCGTSGDGILCTTAEAREWFDTYIGKHLQILKEEESENFEHFFPGFLVYLKDGGILYVSNYLYDMDFFTDAKALSNKQPGKNYFRFRFNPIVTTGEAISTTVYTHKPAFEAYATEWDGTRESLRTTGVYACSKDSGYCSKLIQYDGWEIADDYPIKF